MTLAGEPPTVDHELGLHLADELREMIRAYDAKADRSQQVHLGPSQIAMECTRCLARMILHTMGTGTPLPPRPNDDPWCRIMGTAQHAWNEKAALYANEQLGTPRWITEQRVYPDEARELLPKGGSADLFGLHRGVVIDHKIQGLSTQRKLRISGPTAQYRGQAHLYGRGYELAGFDVRHVAIASWRRGGRLSDLFVWTEPYDAAYAGSVLARYRLIRDLATANGESILPHLPTHADCWECGGGHIDAQGNDDRRRNPGKPFADLLADP